jgi:hypothetical protein
MKTLDHLISIATFGLLSSSLSPEGELEAA